MRKLFTVLILLCPATAASGFVCEQTNGYCFHWASGSATLTSQLGAPSSPLINGTVTWDQNAINAADDWNLVGAAFHFTVNPGGPAIDPCPCPNSAGNPVIFTDNACGGGFGDIVAQTTDCFNVDTGELANASVFVSSSGPWNAYDGPVRPPLNDIRRVLLHEFGHVLGLNHPDSAGQSVAAIMNSHESNIDRLQTDDIQGLFSIYPNMAPPPPANGVNGCQLASSASGSSAWVLCLPAALAGLRKRRNMPLVDLRSVVRKSPRD